MNRKLPLVIALTLTAATSSPLLALGVGEVEVRSRLSAPLRATLPLTDVDGVDPRRMRVSLADEAAFEQAGLSRDLLARGIDFSIERQAGELVVAMRSEQPVRDPFLDLLLDIDWPDGRVLRQVTLLFDPPGYEDSPVLVAGASVEAAAASAQPPISPPSEPPAQPSTAAAASRSSDPAEVRSGDTLWATASRLRPGDDIDINQMMLALVEANPDAFPSGNINSMRAGVTLNVPSRQAITRRSPSDASALVQTQNQAWAARQSDGGAAVAASALSAPAAAGPTDAEVEPVTVAEVTEPDETADSADVADNGVAAETPRLTLLSDEELAAEQQATDADEMALDDAAQMAGLAVASDAETGQNGGDGPASGDASNGGVDQDERLMRVENELLASQQALANVEAERDRLQQEMREMRDELAAMREQLAQLSASGTPSEVAGAGGVTPPTASPAPEPEPWWGGRCGSKYATVASPWPAWPWRPCWRYGRWCGAGAKAAVRRGRGSATSTARR